jgi:uroporphyrin-III C-methyltransferase
VTRSVVARGLIGQGLAPSTPVALIESASRPGRVASAGTIASLPALAAARGNGPALIVIGEVVRDVAAQPATEARPRVAAVR